MERIEYEVLDTLKRHNCINQPLFVGVSGGADSMALLVALKRNSINVTALHVNFHLRNEESNGDQHFVQSFCQQQGIECRVYECDTYKYANERGISIEMAARELRYNWFAEQCGEKGIILIAHNADDVAETTLLNQIRGTGILGMCGIREKNGNILRPLLKFKHSELLEYLAQNGIEHREDSTNHQNIAKRNTLRNSVFPILKQLNPSVVETLGSNAIRMQGIEAIYRAEIERLKQTILTEPIAQLNSTATAIKIDTEVLNSTASPITVAYEILAPLGFNEEQIASFTTLCQSINPGKQLVGNEYKILFERDGVYIAKNSTSRQQQITINQEGELSNEIKTETGKLSFQIIENNEGLEIVKEKHCAYFDLDKIHFPLTIREIKNGDKIKPFGMHGRSKLVSDILNDAKINSYEREKIPLLCDSNGIMWIVGVRASEEFKITPETQRILIVRI